MENRQSRLEEIGFERRNEVRNESYNKEKDYYNDYENILKNSALTNIGKNERSISHPEYDMVIENDYEGEDYSKDYENILKNSTLAKIGKAERSSSHPEYDMVIENDYEGEDYSKEYEKILKGSRLTVTGEKIRSSSHPSYTMDIDEPNAGEGYGLSSVKKGSPEDGGHTHSIPSRALSSTAIVPQLATFEGGDEKDVAQRDYLLAINKYNRTRAYTPTSLDTSLNEAEGQYFIP